METDDGRRAREEPGAAAGRDPLVGLVLGGQYRVDRVIGHGGMGTVYLARQLGLDRSVALKVLSERMAGSAAAVERFRREAATVAKLRHPNVVAVYGFDRIEDGRACLAMEYLPGPTLERWLGEHGHLPPPRAVEYLGQACRAVGAMHRAGIVHRDIKAANIVLPDPADPDDVVRVVDFGIAQLRGPGGGPGRAGEGILGTPAYLAPEVVDGEEADARSDIYALGVVAFQALAGRLPFDGPTSSATLLQHLTQPPPRPSEVAPHVPPSFDAPLLRALEKDPGARYEDAGAFAAALREALAGADSAPAPSAPALLVIDDEEDLLAIMRATLTRAGYDVTTASDGVDALLRLGSRTFDLILSDVDMPNLDGFTLLEMASKKGVRTPVIFVTGKADPESEVRGLELGAEDYVRKPVLPPVLLARVKSALARRRAT
jgi:serine/threonine-protein kinase